MNMFANCLSFIVLISYTIADIDKQFIKFYLYTPENVEVPLLLHPSNWSQETLSRIEEVKFILHGFTEDSTATWVLDIKTNYLKIGTENVITVDWGRYAKMSYFFIKDHVEELATVFAEGLMDLADTQGIRIDMFHLVAFSFSSHIVGLAGKIIYECTGQQIGRITAMDPAGPFFIGEPPERRLNKNDAKFVDIIHTFVVTGYFDPIGDMDFWPNGGLLQLGCTVTSPCSHVRAALYFAESILSKNFTSRFCLSYIIYNSGMCNFNRQAVMGEYVDRTLKGNYFLYTNSKPPYACNC